MKTFLLFLAILFTAFALIVVVENKEAKADTFGSTLTNWWTLDSSRISGTTVTDSSSSGNNGTAVNAPTAALGRLGQALTFNGTTQTVTLVVNTAPASVPAAFKNLASNASSYSFSAWIKTSASATIGATAPWASGNNIIEARNTTNASTQHAWSFGMEGGKLSISRTTNIFGSTVDNLRVNSTTSVNDNKWHFVAATVSTNAVSLYIDGKLNTTGTFAGNASGDCSVGSGTNNVYVQLAARTTNAAAAANWWSGQLDDVRIFNATALSTNDVASLFNLGLGHHHGAF